MFNSPTGGAEAVNVFTSVNNAIIQLNNTPVFAKLIPTLNGEPFLTPISLMQNKLDTFNVTNILPKTAPKLNELINKVNSNLLFFNGYSYNDSKNIYTPSYLTIGNYASTYSNAHTIS